MKRSAGRSSSSTGYPTRLLLTLDAGTGDARRWLWLAEAAARTGDVALVQALSDDRDVQAAIHDVVHAVFAA